jgi:hypothetical protein
MEALPTPNNTCKGVGMKEQFKPHELAARLQNAPYEIVDGQVKSERLGSLIRRAARCGVYGKFEENEHGHVQIYELQRGLARDDAAYTVGLAVTFNDPLGRATELGRLHYIDDEPKLGTAYVNDPEVGAERPLLPEEPAWDVVVGTVERAVEVCWQRRFGAGEEA